MAASLNSPSPVSFSSSSSYSSASRSRSRQLGSLSGFFSSPEFRELRIESGSLKFPIRGRNLSVSRRCSGGKVVCEAQGTAVDIPAVTDATWQELVVKAKGPVLVEVWAPWCGPCRMIHPVIEELSEEYAGKLKFYRLNTDESPSIASKYSIRTIPTMVIFNNGEKKDYVIGAVPKSTLTTMIKKFV